MLVHSIIKHEPPPEEKKRNRSEGREWSGDVGSQEHLRFIHGRVLSNCKFLEGEHVKYKGMMGLITEILDANSFGKLEWVDFECRCIEVFLYDLQTFELCHPSRLTRTTNVRSIS